MISQAAAMAEEFQVCSGNWWTSPRNLFRPSPCSSAINDIGNLGWGWQSNCNELIMDINNTARSSEDSVGSASDGSSSILRDKTQPQIDYWHQDFLHDGTGGSQENYSQLMNPDMLNFKNSCEDFSTYSFKQVNEQGFSAQRHPLDSTANSIESCPATCEEISVNFPLNSSSYSYGISSLLQTLFGEDNTQPQVLPFLDDQETNYNTSEANYEMKLLSSLPNSSSMVIKPPKQQPANNLHFTNTTPLWNASASALSNDSSNFIPSTHPQILPSIHKKDNIPHISTTKNHREEAREVAKKQKSSEQAFKRPRIETPSPLPAFKVRKEKLGDRITALQQLVSPFGKTDTASVLQEAIEYVKFLHDQVNVLTTPYLKNGTHTRQHQQADNKSKDQEGLKQNLKSRGLCLVPISSTFPVAAATTSDFWTHTFGVSFK